MTPLAGQTIVTASQMHAAELAAGVGLDVLMERAGAAIAATAMRLGGRSPVLVLCGPGNNGGDGYVAARLLAEAGVDVRVAASGPAIAELARNAAVRWTGPVEQIGEARSAPVLVDALFGTGLSRPLEVSISDALMRLAKAARMVIAVDLPSGIATDDGAVLSAVPGYHLTLALGAAKPAHVLQPAARHMGAVRVADIGVAADSDMRVLDVPVLPRPGPDSHKYSRGMVAVVAGSMAGAALLSAEAALHAGAGYVALLGGDIGGPHALVRKPLDAMDDRRMGALVVGPGLGRDEGARRKLDAALASGRPLVIDGDALHLVEVGSIPGGSILTPHAGEFDALFGAGEGSKIDRTRAAAARSGAVVIFKGADTVIAAPNGRVRVAEPASPWLSAAGTGDVLAGAIGAMLAAGLKPFDAAQAGVWLHARAAARLGEAFVADDLARALAKARP